MLRLRVTPVATLLSDAVASRTSALTDSFKAAQNREAAKIAAAVALWYLRRTDSANQSSIEEWLSKLVPVLISGSDRGARGAAAYYTAVRRLEVPTAPAFNVTPSIGVIDTGVRASLIEAGPKNAAAKIAALEPLELTPAQRMAMSEQAYRAAAEQVAAVSIRHAQAGARQTIYDNTYRDGVTLGWTRVTSESPCFFCAMLASRGLHYSPYGERSFDASNSLFSGDGDAKVHNSCRCSMKQIYAEADPVLRRTEKFTEMWDRWGAGGGKAALRFRRGYEHFQKTGEYLSWEKANDGLGTRNTLR